MAANKQSVREAILAAVPEDGSAIGNQALYTLLQGTITSLTEDQYQAARDELIAEGSLGRGRGRGGSVFLITEADEDAEDDSEADDFELTAPEVKEAAPRKANTGKRRRKSAKLADGAQVLSYRHTDTRVNNPEAGMVDTGNDPDEPKTVWA